MKPFVWKLARHAGLLSAWRRKHRLEISILAAHGIMDDGAGAAWQPLWKRLHVEHFERVLRLLQAHYEFIPLSEAVAMLRGDTPVRPRCMVLTFDDGYRNNFTHALPILERLGIPATFFICTGMVGTQRLFWIDRLDYAIQHLPPRERIVPLKSGAVVLRFDTRAALAASYAKLRIALKRTYHEDLDARVDALADELEREAGVALADVVAGDPWAGTMTWDDARDAQRRGVEIGSHAVDHLRLPFIGFDAARRQIEESHAALVRELGAARPCLAYPNGDCSPQIARATESAGFAAAVTTANGLNAVGDDLFTLRRISFPTRKDPDHVLALASGFQMAVERIRARTGT